MELTHKEVSARGGRSRWAKIKSKKARSRIMKEVSDAAAAKRRQS